MIPTLLLSILIEGIIAIGYSRWRRNPAGRLLLALVAANVSTQLLLWAVLNLAPGHYLPILFSAEALIWMIEGVILYLFPGTELGLREALMLSLVLNLASFGIGWFLPV